MKVAFTVVKCSPNQNGGHVLKLTCETSEEIFGMKKSVKRTYYIGGMPEAVDAGTVHIVEMDWFNVKEYEYAHPETGEILNLKWLHLRPEFERKG